MVYYMVIAATNCSACQITLERLICANSNLVKVIHEQL